MRNTLRKSECHSLPHACTRSDIICLNHELNSPQQPIDTWHLHTSSPHGRITSTSSPTPCSTIVAARSREISRIARVVCAHRERLKRSVSEVRDEKHTAHSILVGFKKFKLRYMHRDELHLTTKNELIISFGCTKASVNMCQCRARLGSAV